jgi:peptidoglycan/xylan/chitin deacetylase (PgdA/CDA1 family)
MIENGSTSLRQLRSLGIRLGASTLYHSGALGLYEKLGRWRRENPQNEASRFMILLYHRVNPDEDPLFPAVSPQTFDAQMGYLAKNFKVLSLVDIIRRVQQGQALEPFTIAVTFDDGYRDNYIFAHPILKQYQLPATVFVATGFVGSDRLMWNDSLAWAVKNTGEQKTVCEIRGREFPISLGTQQDKAVSLNLLLEELKPITEDQKKETVTKIVNALRAKSAAPPSLMLNWSELRAMAQEGWDIGSHTVDHAILTSVELSRAAQELRLSKEAIEQELQRPAELCAFPNGKRADFNGEIKRMVKTCGYRAAATTLRGINDRNLDLFELRRWSVWETHLPTLACKLGYLYRRQSSHEHNS